MPTVDELWRWLYEPLQELKKGYVTDPGQAWETRKESLLRDLGVSTADGHPVTEQLLRRLDELPESERDNTIGSDQLDSLAYGIVQEHGEEPAQPQAVTQEAAGVAPVQEQEQQAPYDPDAFYAFVRDKGGVWDGTAATWGQFREYFVYYAAESGVQQPATALLDSLEAYGPAERVAVLAQYGVVIGGPASGAVSQQSQEEEEFGDEDIDEMMAELLRDNPEFASLPEERRREIIVEALSEQSSTE